MNYRDGNVRTAQIGSGNRTVARHAGGFQACTAYAPAPDTKLEGAAHGGRAVRHPVALTHVIIFHVIRGERHAAEFVCDEPPLGHMCSTYTWHLHMSLAPTHR